MTHPPTLRRTVFAQVLAIAVVALFVGAEVARAGGGASSTRTHGSSSSSSSHSSSGASSSSHSGSVSSGDSAASRSAVPSVSAHGRQGASRSRTGHSVGRGGRGGVSIGYGSSFFWHPYWGYWGWDYGWGPGYGYGYPYAPPVRYSATRGYRMGALDLRVDPKRTEVYVDGQYVGLAKQYDGFPGHLWLESGVYEISFYKPGFETQTRNVKVMTDLVLEMDIRMVEGEAVEPEMRYDSDETKVEPEEMGAAYGPSEERRDLQARMYVDVEPGNALVYLDGNVLGTADELAGLHAGLLLSAGSHHVEVVRRGFESAERQLDVEPGEEVQLVVELRPTARTSS
jgi:PEGA domain